MRNSAYRTPVAIPVEVDRGRLTEPPVLAELSALGRYFRDANAPWLGKAFLVAALAYVVMPADAIPDILPVIGWIDDLGVGALALAHLLRMVKQYREG